MGEVGPVRWGCRVEGSFVIEVADGLSAFRVEERRRAAGDETALAVWSIGNGQWYAVPPESVLRPDPLPPPQAVWWRRMWRGGKFRRRGNA